MDGFVDNIMAYVVARSSLPALPPQHAGIYVSFKRKGKHFK